MNTTKYYIISQGAVLGPYSCDSIPAISPETLVWHENIPEWVQASSLPELSEHIVFTPVPPAAPVRRIPAKTPEPHTWLIESILVTIFLGAPAMLLFPLCITLVLGIMAMIKASSVSTMYQLGHNDAALEYSRQARNYMLGALISGIIIIFLTIVTVVIAIKIFMDYSYPPIYQY
ncbi:MAG: CD225/dispanin family protein [Muribaculaceae bacterium]|nr:CD225/dispanin family protein [Muribaculaceae bacterium]